MKQIFKSVAAAALAMSAASPLWAQTPMTSEEADAAVRALAEVVDNQYFDAERAHQISADMIAALESGTFADITNTEALSSALTEMLLEEDRHFQVNYAGMDAVERANAAQTEGAGSDGGNDGGQADFITAMRRQNFGFMNVEILPGNIGYIDLHGFAPIEPARDTATAALNFIAHTDAVIFDMRRNGGGSPAMVQYLISHFLENDGETVINTFVSRRSDEPQLLMSLADHPAGHRPDTPLAVLTSARSGSAGEAFPYHLQAMDRATIIGETTYGAGNPGDTFLTDTGFSIFVSTGSARNPITMTNWEGVGVQPDIEIPADEALDRALIQLYGELSEATEDPFQARELSWAAESIAAELEPVELTEDALSRYAGNFGMRRTWIEDGALRYQRGDADPYTLIALGDDRFKFPDDDRFRLIFQFDDTGALTGMTMQVADGRVIPNPVVTE